MDLIRGNDGEMEPIRPVAGRKVLLPWEIQICEALDICPDEYFEYFDLLQQAKQKRNAEYQHLPEVVNEAATTAIVLTVVGIAFQVASALLAPKPKAPEQQKRRGNVQGDDVRGRTKYAPLRQFDSVQQLATLSDVVPLVYADKKDNSLLGGVRVESQLLWSQIKNRHTYQIVKVLLLFSGGEIGKRPDFYSYAFGSQKIQSYGRSRVDMSFAYGTVDQGPLLRNPDQNGPRPVDYPEGTYQEDDAQREYFALFNNGADGRPEGTYLDFCGVQTPSTSAQFGQYSPIANGSGYRYPWQFPGKGDGDADQKDRIYSIRTKAVATYFYLGSRITRDGSNRFKLRLQSSAAETAYIVMAEPYSSNPEITNSDHWRGGQLTQIKGSAPLTQDADSEFAELSGGFGSATNAADENCETADTSITIGDLFLLGDIIVKCTAINRNEPWETENRFGKEYTFEVDDSYTAYGRFDGQRIRHIDTDANKIYRPDYMYPLQRVSIGAASTTRKVDAVEIGIKSIVYRRINGFPNVNQHLNSGRINDLAIEGAAFEYGTLDRYTPRISFFRVEYRDIETAVDNWIDISPGVPFAVRGSTPQGEYSAIKIYHDKRGQFEYRFIPISGNCFASDDYAQPQRIPINMLNGAKSFDNAGASAPGLKVYFRGRRINLDNSNTNSQNMVVKTWTQAYRSAPDSEKFKRNLIGNDVICDMYTYDAEDSSHRNDPEHTIVYLNELKKNEDAWYSDKSKHYSRLCYAGMTIAASRDFSNLSDVSAYFTKGIQVERLTEMTGGGIETDTLPGRPDGNDSTNLFPEIAYDLLTNKVRGAGELVGRGEVHEGKMREAARFCQANNFLWDGVVSDAANIRDFIYEQAVYCLLDFTIIGGMFALVPTVPYKSDYTIDREASVSNGRLLVRALFTDGNMRNYKTTFLASAERENFVAEVKYREERLNGFPEMKSFRIRLADIDNDDRNEFTTNDTVEVFDLTQFCTNRQHAIDFAKFALLVRERIDHAVVFETTPDCIASLAPGQYIRVASAITHNSQASRINVGCITTSGVVQGQQLGGTFEIYYWKPAQREVQRGRMVVGTDGKVTDTALHGSLFSVVTDSVDDPKIYKLESISLTEDGMVEVAASYQPLTDQGTLAVLDWDDSNFVLTE